MQALINPGDEVIIPVPYWVTYKDVVNYAGGKCVFVDTDEANGFTLTAAMIEPHLNANAPRWSSSTRRPTRAAPCSIARSSRRSSSSPPSAASG